MELQSLKDFAASKGVHPTGEPPKFSVMEDLFPNLPQEDPEPNPDPSGPGSGDAEPVRGKSLQKVMETGKVKDLNLTNGFGLIQSE